MNKKSQNLLNNESGSALIFALLMLVLLTIMGLTGLNNTDFELQIAANDRLNKRDFYVAESGWIHGLQWVVHLNEHAGIADPDPPAVPSGLGGPPFPVNSNITDENDPNRLLIRNYGNGANGILNDSFLSGTEDGIVTAQNIPYWFKVEEESNVKAEGDVPGSRDCIYLVTSTADGRKSIEVRVNKIFIRNSVGY